MTWLQIIGSVKQNKKYVSLFWLLNTSVCRVTALGRWKRAGACYLKTSDLQHEVSGQTVAFIPHKNFYCFKLVSELSSCTETPITLENYFVTIYLGDS